MERPTKTDLLIAAVTVICLLLLFEYATPLEASEYSGGRLTGRLLNFYDVGMALLLIAFLLAFFWRRVAAACALPGGLLCLPVFLYDIFPGPFRRLFPGEYSVPLVSNVELHLWTLICVAMIVASILLNFRTLLRRTA